MRPNIDFMLATAPSRKSKQWKNSTCTWHDLLEKLKNPTKTGETVAEYKAMKKAERDARKDIGGFVGGYLAGGRRLKRNVRYRQLVSLDADSPGDGFLDTARRVLADAEYCIYSTHSHTKQSPRYRLIIPLVDKVSAEQYQAVSRKIAYEIGMEHFDPTTYAPERMMYWPSVPVDSAYYFECQQKENSQLLNPETVLASYADWRDMSLWPTSTIEDSIVARGTKKQGEPTEKPGIIGAFNRVYTIPEAIEAFLGEIYEPCAVENRYTYTAGSAVGGLVIYDGVFAYSHHGTDITSGKLCNAFDLVRLHRFGEQDEDVEEGTPVNRLPSYTAMMELCRRDAAVMAEYHREDNERISAAWDDTLLEDNTAWLEQLERSGGRNPKILTTASNLILILTNDPALKNAFGTDEFSHRATLKRDLPWRKMGADRLWRDSDDASLRNYLSRVYGITGRGVIDDALIEVMALNGYHPVRNYLDGLVWDEIPRLERLYIEYLGAEDTLYNREVTKQHLKAAVARILVPGIKFDPCLVLSGPQGIGKSTILAKLGRHWFNDSIVSIQGKEAMEQLQGTWIAELAEMQAVTKADNELIKAFISRQSDKFRVPFGRRTEEYKRQCVFAATTNDSIFLKDRTGGRRFWPVFVGVNPIERNATKIPDDEIDQIWAEAKYWWEAERDLELSPEVRATAKELQEAHTEGGEKYGLILDYLDKKLPENWNRMDIYERREYLESYEDAAPGGVMVRDRVCTLEIWCEALGGKKENLTNAQARELNAILQNTPGWRSISGKKRFGNLYGVQKGYYRISG